MSVDDDVVSGHLQELRRGTVVVAALAILRTPGYGYALLETLAGAGFGVDANTLYPLLRRLEKQGLLTARVEHRRGPAAQVLRAPAPTAWSCSRPCATTGAPSTPPSPT